METNSDREVREQNAGSTPLYREFASRSDLTKLAGPGAPDDLSHDPDLLAELADFDLTDEQARELLALLVRTMSLFVELGFSGDFCGQFVAGILADHNAESSCDKIQDSIAGHEEVRDE